MTDLYVRSTDGNNADDGSSWALAKATLAGAAAIDVAGDRIFVSQVHSETVSSSATLGWAGTVASPVQILCVNDSTGVLTTGAVVAITGVGLTLTGHIYQYGITYNIGDPVGNASLLIANAANDVALFERCSFIMMSGSGSRVSVSGSSANLPKIHWKSCDVKFGANSQYVNLTQANFIWEGGILLAGGVTPIALVNGASPSRGATAIISGLDLSNADSGMNLFAGSGYSAIIRNCKLPASWSGVLYSGVMTAGGRVEMHNCDSADTNYRVWVKEYTAELTQETTIVRASGASDGVTAISWKIATTANCNFLSGRFQSPEIVKWNESTGSPLTATVEIVHDSVTALNDDEAWLEVQYLGTSGYPLGSFISDSKTDVLATPAAQTSSSATWTTTGLANPNKQKLSVTFTPQEKGYVHARVCVGKESYAIYVDPLLTVA